MAWTASWKVDLSKSDGRKTTFSSFSHEVSAHCLVFRRSRVCGKGGG